ncbi:uncharacterized protein LOC143428815 [Xylocopa sonorina]|uniref:uncharacterized protein LOC143428815 n=1 Tax=Xylocopa sonorina TaxID=1818115 RepID=UPI00403B0859
MDNHRKILSQAATVTGKNWAREMCPDSPRYSNLDAYHHDCASEHEIRYPEGRTSQETVVEIEEADVNKNNSYNYPDEPVYPEVFPSHNSATQRDKYPRFNDYSEHGMTEAVTALQKLQRLKELQMKRDLTERYYSQEIKRLIGEYYFGPRFASPSFRSNGGLQSSSFQQSSGDRLRNASKNLEPCGTMTTITRLDCGCIEKTTRPIFTTARGRVQRKNCNQSQKEMFLKLTPSNPQEHLFSSLEEPQDRYRGKMKKRHPLGPRVCGKVPPVEDQEFEVENGKKNDEPKQEVTEHTSRPASPHRKFSDTTVTSY